MTRRVELRRGQYRDSVALMQVSQRIRALDGVDEALVAMATEVNVALLVQMGFTPPIGHAPNDMLVALAARDEAAADAATAELDRLLAAPERPAASVPDVLPRTTGSAARGADATLALVSVPGEHAFVEAMDALVAGLSVMVFSDNVPVGQEIRLKEEAASRGLLVMGPDCGTAVVGGVGLGFANVVRPGPVSIVAASGTGAQHLMSLLDGAGVGVRHCLGVGGRDLSAAVAGRSTRRALEMLARDTATELVVIVSKPPDPDVADSVQAYARGLGKPVVLALLGPERPNLTRIAEQTVTSLGKPWQPPRSWLPPATAGAQRAGALRGLFSGGTLCDEAMITAEPMVGPIRSNVPLRPDLAIGPDLRSGGHLMIDFGDDALTVGRPHPMIDPTARLVRLAEEAADPACTVVLLDVVLGHGAHPDPASQLAPAIAAARRRAGAAGRELTIVVSLIGTRDDPQDHDRQAIALTGAGAIVTTSNADAAMIAATIASGRSA